MASIVQETVKRLRTLCIIWTKKGRQRNVRRKKCRRHMGEGAGEEVGQSET